MIHPSEPQDELIICFDDSGKLIEPHTRAEVHQQPIKYWHGVTAVYVVNTQGQILCSKRSEHLSQKPGKWQAGFGGHINVGQTYIQNAVKELGEEVGITLLEQDLFFLGEGKNEEHKHIVESYACLYKGPLEQLNFSDGEITEVKWMGLAEAWQDRLNSPEKWASACSPEKQEKIKQWLKLQ